MLAGNVLLSALAISPYSAADSARSESDAEQEKERSARMANLLGFTVVCLLCSGVPLFNIDLLVWPLINNPFRQRALLPM